MAKETANDEFTGEVDLSPEEQEALGQPTEEEIVDDDEESTSTAGMQSPEDVAAAEKVAKDDLTKIQDEKATADAEAEQKRMVPHQAMHEERALRQQAQEQLRVAQEQNQVLADRMAQILERLSPKEEPQVEAVPNKEEQPFEYMEWLENQVKQIQTTTAQKEQQSAAEKQQSQLWETGNNLAREYRNSLENPEEYDGAFNYMMQKRGEELVAMGTPKEHIAQMLQQETWQGMQYALANKINPGQMLHNLAKSRGYTKPAPAPQPGRQPAQQPPATPAVDYDAARKANRSMSRGGGTRNDHATMSDLANMSDKDFEKWLDVNGDEGLALAHGLQ